MTSFYRSQGLCYSSYCFLSSVWSCILVVGWYINLQPIIKKTPLVFDCFGENIPFIMEFWRVDSQFWLFWKSFYLGCKNPLHIVCIREAGCENLIWLWLDDMSITHDYFIWLCQYHEEDEVWILQNHWWQVLLSVNSLIVNSWKAWL